MSSKNIKVLGLTLALSGGDGIYLGVSKTGVPSENVVIKDVICDRNYRQGISVISARNLLIENTIMRDTGGTPPAAGIDFEPNEASERIVRCVMRNCVAENNQGDGYVFYLPAHSLPDNESECTCRIRFALSLKKAPPEKANKSPAGPTETPTSRLEVIS